mmetsp:Transcript_55421/g.164759  ORF Transcript_55421/g.164759 Transcript_55421/m.164759 type:complete len:279 (-) Transcript_55421:112-948(-)
MPTASSSPETPWDGEASSDDGFEVVGQDDVKVQAFDEVSIPSSDGERDWQFLDAEDKVSLSSGQAAEDEEDQMQESTAASSAPVSKPEESVELDVPAEEAEEPEGSEEPEAAEEPEEMPEAALPLQTAAAALLAGAPLHLGSNLLAECEGFRGDITKQWAAAFEGFPCVVGAFCLGRLLVLPGRRPGGAPAVARAVVINNGCTAWPAATALRIVAGDAYGFGAMHVGSLLPGEGADLALDLVLPTDGQSGSGRRSAWVLTDDCGEPFGPLLVLEVVWA